MVDQNNDFCLKPRLNKQGDCPAEPSSAAPFSLLRSRMPETFHPTCNSCLLPKATPHVYMPELLKPHLLLYSRNPRFHPKANQKMYSKHPHRPIAQKQATDPNPLTLNPVWYKVSSISAWTKLITPLTPNTCTYTLNL